MPTGNMALVESREHARGALYGLAIGDALGMPTQLLTRAEVTGRWGPRLSGFEPAPPGHPLADGMPAGSVTDDTEQAVLLARLLISGHGEIDPREWASALVDWERDMAARGSLDLLGPSTKRAVSALLAGASPQEAAAAAPLTGRPCASPRSASPSRWAEPLRTVPLRTVPWTSCSPMCGRRA